METADEWGEKEIWQKMQADAARKAPLETIEMVNPMDTLRRVLSANPEALRLLSRTSSTTEWAEGRYAAEKAHLANQKNILVFFACK